MNDPIRSLYRRLAEVSDEVADVVPLIRELQEQLLIDESNRPNTGEEDYWGPNDCLEKLASRDRQSTIALAHWLTNDDLVDCGKSLLQLRGRRDFAQDEPLPIVDVFDLETGMTALCACRLSALAIYPRQALAWTLAIASTATDQGDAQKVATALLRYHIEEFPLTTQRVLSNLPEAYRQIQLAQEALKHLQLQDEQLDKHDQLTEFSMSLSVRTVAADRKRRERRQIERAASSSSLLASLFKPQYLKYANTTSIEARIGDQIKEQSLAMAPHRMSLELPLSEALDPQMGLIRRERLWKGRFA